MDVEHLEHWGLVFNQLGSPEGTPTCKGQNKQQGTPEIERETKQSAPQATVLQTRDSYPLPHTAFAVRVWYVNPEPHVAEHEDQADQGLQPAADMKMLRIGCILGVDLLHRTY